MNQLDIIARKAAVTVKTFVYRHGHLGSYRLRLHLLSFFFRLLVGVTTGFCWELSSALAFVELFLSFALWHDHRLLLIFAWRIEDWGFVVREPLVVKCYKPCYHKWMYQDDDTGDAQHSYGGWEHVD